MVMEEIEGVLLELSRQGMVIDDADGVFVITKVCCWLVDYGVNTEQWHSKGGGAKDRKVSAAMEVLF